MKFSIAAQITVPHSQSQGFLLISVFWLAALINLCAQQPAESELLKVSSPRANSKQKFKLGEYLTVVVRTKNKWENAVYLSVEAFVNGRRAARDGYESSSVESKNSTTVNVSLTCREPAIVDEIKVNIRDKANNQTLASVGVPVQMTWGDSKSVQQPVESKLLKIISPAPNSKQQLKLGEYLPIEVQCKNSSNNPVSVYAYPCANGSTTFGYGYRSANVEPKATGTVHVLLTCRRAAVADEIKVVMMDKVTNEELAVIGVPVQMTWVETRPAPVPVTKPAPSQVPAPVVGQSAMLKVRAIQPASPGKLPLGEPVTIEIEFNNPSETPVRVFATPYSKGSLHPKCISAGSNTFPKGAGTVKRYFYSREATEVDEIKITMVDSVTRQEVAVLKLPVQLMWGDGTSAPTAKPKSTVKKTGPMRLEFQGYEVSQDAAATLFIAQPARLDPKAFLAATAALASVGKAAIVKLPFVEASSDSSVDAAPVNGYSLQARIIRGNDGATCDVTYWISRGSDSVHHSNSIAMYIDGIAFIGSLPGSSADKVVLVFARITNV